MGEFNRKVTIREVVSRFNFEQISGNDESLNRWVIVPDINRPGLELAGFQKVTEPRRIVVIGEKEQAYIDTLSEEVQRQRFIQITDAYTPMIILSSNRECPPILLEIARYMNFPVFKTPLPSYRLIADLIAVLDDFLGPTDSIHGVLMGVYNRGILITGESGMGKSEIALELIKRGHVLVADDRVDVLRSHNAIKGQSPELLRGMLEIRGIGVIDVDKMFGASTILSRTNIDYIIHLTKYDNTQEYARVGIEEVPNTDILGIQIPTLVLPVKEGRSMAVLIESAVTNFILKETGYNSAKEFERRVFEHIQRENEKNKEAEA